MKKWTTFLVVSVLILFSSCESEMDKYYQLPDWLKGNAWEVMEDKGNFKLFLSAVEKTSFKDLVQGKGIITVMAPTDEAFQAYLTENGYASVDAIPAVELEKLVAYHLVYYSFTKGQFEDYKPNGIESENVLKGIYYKFRTKSRDAISTWSDVTANDVQRRVIHKDRFLPVFSFNLFESMRIDAKENYEYFYPNSIWTGANGFNVSNASVIDYAIVTDNGYVYTIDKVLQPLETVYTELSKSTDFSVFKNAYDRFVTYEYDAKSSAEYGNGDSLYIRYHSALPPIASEWTTYPSALDYTQLSVLSRTAHNVFAPDNQAMQAFFNKYWSEYYTNINEVNFLPMLFFLYNHVHSGDIVFPETIEKGQLRTSFSTPITFNRNDAKIKHMCVNGTLYGLNKVLVPPMFQKVSAPMFCNPQYNIILDMMLSSGFETNLLSDEVNFKVFYPTNEIITANTTIEGRRIQYLNTNSKKYGAQQVQIEGDVIDWEAMRATQKKSIAGNHIAIRKMTSRGDEAVYKTINSYNYLYVKGNKVYSSLTYNLGDETRTPEFTKIEGDWNNGDAYALSGDFASALVPETNQIKNILTTIASPAEYAYFKEAVLSSGMDKTSPPYNFLQGERFIILIPTNDAVYNGWLSGKIPFSPAATVANYLRRYFINVNASGLLDYPFPGAGVQGTLVSFANNSQNTTATYTLIDSENGLKVRDAKGNEVNVVSYFPRIYADGAVYLIDGLLDVE